MNSMVDNQKVYQAIKTIADELCKENKTYLRADLAFELKKYGIASDSSEVSKLVFDAYRYFHDNGNIAIAFVSNNSRTTLVAEYKLNDSLEQGNKEEALKIAETELALSSSALEQLKEQVEQNLNLVLVKGTSKMADIVMGTNGVKDVRRLPCLINIPRWWRLITMLRIAFVETSKILPPCVVISGRFIVTMP